jgi:hypothetical protein
VEVALTDHPILCIDECDIAIDEIYISMIREYRESLSDTSRNEDIIPFEKCYILYFCWDFLEECVHISDDPKIDFILPDMYPLISLGIS